MKDVVRLVISDLEDGKVPSVNILQAMRMVDKAIILNCFKRCGFSFDDDQQEGDVSDEGTDGVVANNIGQAMAAAGIPDVDFLDLAHVDEDVAVMGSLTDAEIVASVSGTQDSDEDGVDEDYGQPPEPVTSKQAREAASIMRSYIESVKLLTNFLIFIFVICYSSNLFYALQVQTFRTTFTACSSLLKRKWSGSAQMH